MSLIVYYTENPDEKIKFIDSEGNAYYLPKTFEIRSIPTSKRSSLMECAFVHGAKDIADGKVNPRKIEISGKIWAATDIEYNQKLDELLKRLYLENFRIQDKGRQINIAKIDSLTETYPSPVDYRYGEVKVILIAADPFWYAVNAQSKEFEVTSSPKNFQFSVGGNVETFPVIIIENNASNTDFRLENTTDGEREFRIQDSGASSGTEIVVDCAAGTVVRDGTQNIISAFSGLFLRLLGGRENKFKYTGANCNITIQYKEAWL